MTNYNIEQRVFNGIDYDVLYPITIIKDVIGLQNELDNKAQLKTLSLTLQPVNWVGDGTTTPFTQQIPVSGLLSTDDVIIKIIPNSNYITAVSENNQFQYISFTTALNGAIKFTCLSIKPTIPLNVKVLCFR